MPTLQSLHDIERAWLHLLRISNHALLFLHRHDAIKLAHHIRRRDILESRIRLITPHSAYAVRFEQRSPMFALGARNIVKQCVQGGIFAYGECTSLDNVNESNCHFPHENEYKYLLIKTLAIRSHRFQIAFIRIRLSLLKA